VRSRRELPRRQSHGPTDTSLYLLYQRKQKKTGGIFSVAETDSQEESEETPSTLALYGEHRSINLNKFSEAVLNKSKYLSD
jgi:hypothetical protein